MVVTSSGFNRFSNFFYRCKEPWNLQQISNNSHTFHNLSIVMLKCGANLLFQLIGNYRFTTIILSSVDRLSKVLKLLPRVSSRFLGTSCIQNIATMHSYNYIKATDRCRWRSSAVLARCTRIWSVEPGWRSCPAVHWREHSAHLHSLQIQYRPRPPSYKHHQRSRPSVSQPPPVTFRSHTAWVKK